LREYVNEIQGLVDTKRPSSGIFFDGNESRILDLVELDLVTCEDVLMNAKSGLGESSNIEERPFEIALAEMDKALTEYFNSSSVKYATIERG